MPALSRRRSRACDEQPSAALGGGNVPPLPGRETEGVDLFTQYTYYEPYLLFNAFVPGLS